MKTIRKTYKKATYFEGVFMLRDNSVNNWAHPIEFPCVFTAYGKAISSGNWNSCTGINTPQYVIDYYFDANKKRMESFWDAVFLLENITWDDVKNKKDNVLMLVNLANNELSKLPQLLIRN